MTGRLDRHPPGYARLPFPKKLGERAFNPRSARVILDDQVRLHLHRIGHVGQSRSADESRAALVRLDLNVIRLRFTPARGEFYGPRQAAQPTPESPVSAVTVTRVSASTERLSPAGVSRVSR